MIDRQHLTILREVDRLGSVTAAADKLNISQSAVSHMMRKFEARHGVAVWEKAGRGLRLTQAGTYLLDLAGRVLPQLEHAERVLEDFASGTRGSLRIGMECHPCQQWLNRVIGPYLRDWPDVDLDIRSAFRFGGIAALLGHEIDLLITPDPVALKRIRYQPVFGYEMVLAVPSGHKLNGKRVAAPQDLSDQTLITYPVPAERLDIFTRFLVPAGCLPRRHRVVETTDVMLQMVAAGRGVSAIPDWLLQEDNVPPGLTSLRLGEAGIPKHIHLGFREDDAAPDFLRGFIETAAQTSPVE
ncbi:LysR family transcriptional regulator [Paracoccus sp. SCSIO 75233]|uniref:LysR family transcriptional regulator n=1 Tax=Paracoccus sp. SCSIO 75233 TaxID=3017782 RepID=UPI0022F01905|nr:LysR family transcriptional regulator [Paracoccus sp. SCSIO 75233]WBU53355.1 LysR family transcriptional regulator [Paracoccus sp. SCSIO 75233]